MMNITSLEEIVVSNGSVECEVFNGRASYCTAIVAVRQTMSILSIIGCLFVIGVIALFRKYTAFTQRIILYLSITAVFRGIFYTVDNGNANEIFCKFLGYTNGYLDWSVLLWVCCITFNLYMNAIWQTNTARYEWAYAVVALITPLVICALPFIDDAYGSAGLWCWIKHNWGWRFGIWYFPLIVIIICMFAVYLFILYRIDQKASAWSGRSSSEMNTDKMALKRDITHLRRYPMVYLLCMVFPLINRIQNAVSNTPIFALVLLHAMTSPIYGAVNAIVFCLDKETLGKLTKSQFMLAFLSWRNRRSCEIQEYPVGTGTTRGLTRSEQDVSQDPAEPNTLSRDPIEPPKDSSNNSMEPNELSQNPVEPKNLSRDPVVPKDLARDPQEPKNFAHNLEEANDLSHDPKGQNDPVRDPIVCNSDPGTVNI